MTLANPGASPRGHNRLAMMPCVHVVPAFIDVQMKMSPGRGLKSFQRLLSKTA
jgi:hypothetical protein